MIDGILAAAVLAGLVLNAALGWWWADPAAGRFGCETAWYDVLRPAIAGSAVPRCHHYCQCVNHEEQ